MAKEGRSKTYGDLTTSLERWDFTEGFPLIGLYGYQTADSRINQVGFYSLDIECAENTPEEQNIAPTPDDFLEPGPTELVTTEETVENAETSLD